MNPRQGLRKRDVWGPCRSCGYPGAFKCSRCGSWRCQTCTQLRKSKWWREGYYLAVCNPRCLGRMTSYAVSVARGAEQ